MIKSWRPKGWKTLKAKSNPLHCFAPDTCIGTAYETGADAMLEKLREQGKYIDASKYPHGFVLNDILPVQKLKRGFKGWMIIIPDEG